MQLGPAEIIVILVIALLVFGPTRLPEVGRQVGRAMREFRKFQQTVRRDVDEVFAHDETSGAEPPPTLPPKATADPTSADPTPTPTNELEQPDASARRDTDVEDDASRSTGNGDGT